jgi:VanZ family protein
MSAKKIIGLWLPVLLWMGVIFAGSSIGSVPQVGEDVVDGIIHRAAHLAEFAVLGWLALRAARGGRALTRRAFVAALIVVALYGVSDEFHQRFTPGRNSELQAVVFDVIGGLIGAAIYWRRRSIAGARHSRRDHG